MIGFGFSFTLFFYLLHTQTTFKDTIATCGFLNIFISTIFTLGSIFCGKFDWLSYLVLFLLTLVISIGSQYLFNSYLEGNVQQTSINSTLAMLIIVVLVLSLFSLVLSVLLTWVRFGFYGVGYVGVVDKC